MATRRAKTAADKTPDLRWKRESAWHKLAAGEEARLEALCRDYLAFLGTAKTEREAYREAVRLARGHGYRPLDATRGILRPGDKVFAGVQGKTLLLAQIGRRPLTDGVRVLGGHVDAPRLDAKPVPLYQDSDLALLDTRYYGGVRTHQWVAIPLAIHGVVVRTDGSSVEICIGEAPDDPVFTITDLLPHLARDQNKKLFNEGIPGEGLNLLIGSRPIAGVPGKGKDQDKDGGNEKVKANILRLLHERFGITEEDLTSAELEIVPAGPPRELGLDRSMLLGYGHDDRVCAYTSLRALLDLRKVPDYTAVALLCDREEIGSVGATGMESMFFENTMVELLARQAASGGDLAWRRCLARSRMLSADVGMLHDPNFAEVSSPNNMARLNAGLVVTKYTGSGGKSGASEASAEFVADVRRVFNAAGVAWQTGELGKVDQGGGGTIAKFLARYTMDVLDCGVGVLSMHAPWEVIGKLDAYMAYKGYGAFLSSGI